MRFGIVLYLALALAACDQNGGGAKPADPPADGGPEGTETGRPEEPTAPPGPPASGLIQYDRAHVEVLIGRLGSSDAAERGMALMSLPALPGHFEKNPDLLKLVREALLVVAGSDDVDTNRGVAIDKICNMGEQAAPAVPELIKLLDDPVARQYVCFDLRHVGPAARAAIPKLSELVRSSGDALARAHAAEALGLLGADAAEAVPALAEALKSDEANMVKLKAAHALGEIGSAARSALPVLEEAAAAGPGNVRFACTQAIASIRSEE